MERIGRSCFLQIETVRRSSKLQSEAMARSFDLINAKANQCNGAQIESWSLKLI